MTIKLQDILMADGMKISAIGRGNIKLELPLGDKYTTVTLQDALYAPQMAFTLVLKNQIMPSISKEPSARSSPED